MGWWRIDFGMLRCLRVLVCDLMVFVVGAFGFLRGLGCWVCGVCVFRFVCCDFRFCWFAII